MGTTAARGGGGKNRIRHLVFDFEHVIGIDATAARACFLMLKSLLRSAGVKVHFAAASPAVARLLRGHGVVAEGEPLYPTLDEAIEACEEALLRSAIELSGEDLRGLSRHPSFYAAARRSRHLSHRALRGACISLWHVCVSLIGLAQSDTTNIAYPHMHRPNRQPAGSISGRRGGAGLRIHPRGLP